MIACSSCSNGYHTDNSLCTELNCPTIFGIPLVALNECILCNTGTYYDNGDCVTCISNHKCGDTCSGSTSGDSSDSGDSGDSGDSNDNGSASNLLFNVIILIVIVIAGNLLI